MYWLKVPGKLACAPASLGRGLSRRARPARCSWLDPQSGDPLAEPFQPRLEPGSGSRLDDSRDRQRHASRVWPTGRSTIYLLGVQDQPKPHLAASAQTAVAKPIAAPLAVLGQTLFLRRRGRRPERVRPAGAGPRQRTVARRPMRWGPAASATTCWSPPTTTTCSASTPRGTSSGARLAWNIGPWPAVRCGSATHYLLASRSGIVWRVEAATGKELAKVDAGYPLGHRPRGAWRAVARRRSRRNSLRSTATMSRLCIRSVSAIALSGALVLRRGAVAETPLYEEEPYDQITLDAANNNEVREDQAAGLPNRQPPPGSRRQAGGPSASTSPTRNTRSCGASIVKLELFEQLVLNKANELVADEQVRRGLRLLHLSRARTSRTRPAWARRSRTISTRRPRTAMRKQQYDSALALLRELHRPQPAAAGPRSRTWAERPTNWSKRT